MNVHHKMYFIVYAFLCTCTVLLELTFCIAVCVFVVLCVDRCITQGSAATSVY
jgi:hypothetical protein